MRWERVGLFLFCLGIFSVGAVGTGIASQGGVTAGDGADATALQQKPSDFQVDIVGTTSPEQGGTLAVTVLVENTGNPSDTQTVELAVDGLGSNSTSVSLGGGDSSEETLSVPTTEGDAGSYTATVSSEDDSDTAAVSVLSPAAFSVDIEVTGTPAAGEPLSVLFSVTNTGDVEDTRTVTLDVGALGTNTTAVTLTGGETRSKILSVETSAGEAGEYTATVATPDDSENATVTVQTQAEFPVSIVEAGEPAEGDDLSMTALVENVGDVEGTATVTLDVGELGSTSREVTLGSGGSSEETLTVGTNAGDAGNYTATVTTGDDAATANVTVLSQAAFAVDIVDVDSDVAGEDLAVTAAVENTGDVEGTGTVTLDIGGLETNATNVTLAGGASVEETLTVGTDAGEAGEYTATVTTGDDAATANVTVLAVGAFTVESVVADEPVGGENLTVTATIENTGDTETTRAVTLDAGELGGATRNVTLGGGESTAVSLAVGTTASDAGTYTATVTTAADSDNTGVTVLGPASFAVEITGANDTVEGEPLVVTAAVTNTGDAEGTGAVTLTTDGLGSNTTNVTLAGNESKAVTLAVGVGDGDAGEYTVAVASPDDSESTGVTVLAQSEFLVEVVATDTPVVEGDPLAVTAAIENVGDVTGTRAVALTADGLGETTTNVTLAGNASTERTLTVGTDMGDAGGYTATVTTGDDAATANVTVLAPPSFAVAVVNVTEPVEGEPLAVTAAVENTGDIEATQTVTLAAGDLGGNETTVTLDGGVSATRTLTVETTPGDAGEYTVAVASENDTASATATVLAPAGFSVDVLDTGEPTEGAAIEVLAAVENTGDLAGTQTVTLDVGDLGTNTTTVALAGNESTEVVLSVATGLGEAGEYTAAVTSENDSDTAPVTLLARSAFVVDVLATGEPAAGERLDVTVAIENLGSAGDTQTVTLAVGELGDNSTTITLDSGASVEETLSVATAAGDAGNYTATVTTADDTVTATATVLVPAAFTVEILDVNAPVEGESLAVTGALENTGEAEGTQTVALDVGSLGENSTTVTLDGGDSSEETLTVATGDNDTGKYTVMMASEDDSDSETVTVLTPASVVVGGLDLADPVAGDPLAVTVAVENTGDVETNSTVDLTVGGLGENTTNVTLAGGESTEVTLTVATAAGDAGNYTATVTTADDAATANLTVLVPATFTVGGVTPDELVAGETLAVTATVENVGDVEATQTVTLEAGALGEDSKAVTLGANESTEQTLTVVTTEGDAGSYTATVTTGDDAATATVTVLAPATFAVEIVAVTEPVAGDPLALVTEVENVGDIEGNATVDLAVGGLGGDSTTLTLVPGASAEETLSVGTGDGDAGNYTVTVSTPDETVSTTATVLAPATFSVSVLDVSESVEGEPVEVLAAVENVGDVAGTQAVALTVGALGENTTNVTLAGGESTAETLTVATTTGDAGEYPVTVTTVGDTANATATVLAEAVFEVDILTTEEPVEGGSIEVTVAVENVGGVEGTGAVDLVAGELGGTATNVTLAGGESTEVTLTVATAEGDAGNYTVTVTTADDAAMANATVLESATFEIRSVQTNSPVVEGDPLTLTAVVENTGDVPGTDTLGIEAAVLGTNATTVSLDSNETVETTLVLSTAVQETGTYTATSSTSDDTDTTAVELHLPTLPNQENIPQDPIGDGLYEDVDGDGAFDIFDVQAFFNHFDTDPVQNHAWAYDFNDGGGVTIFDVQALFNRL